MYIAIVTPTLNYGGGERQVEFLASGLAGNGHSVRVYCLFDDGPIADRLAGKGIKVHRLYNRAARGPSLRKKRGAPARDSGIFRKNSGIIDRSKRLANECLAALKLFVIFIRRRPDVVHLYQNQTKMAILAARIAGVKKVVYTETSHIGDWLSPSQLSVMKFFWRRCDTIIVLSGSMKRQMESLGAADPQKIRVLPTMLPFPGGHETETAGGKKDVGIGIIGRFTPEKGHIFFLKAAELIKKQRDDVKFVIAGEGYLQEELVEFTKKSGLAAYTDFTGRFNDLKEVMGRIDILVLSSLTEGLPLVLLEAMAFGKAIVATDVGGVTEVIRNGDTGFIVPPKDPQAIADAVLRLVGDPDLRARLAVKAAQRFKDEYLSETVVPKIELLYQGGKN